MAQENVEQKKGRDVAEQVKLQQTLKIGLNPGNKRGESTNPPVLQQQANDILSRIARAKK